MSNQEQQLEIVSSDWRNDLGPNEAYLLEIYSLYLQDPALVGDSWAEYFRNNPIANGSPITFNKNGTNGQQHIAATPHVNSHSVGQGIVVSSASAGGSTGYYAGSAEEAAVQERVYRMISAIRGRGHFKAKINPLTKGIAPLPFVEDIQVEFYNFTSEQLNRTYNCSGLGGRTSMVLKDLMAELEKVYCNAIGFEFTHLINQEERLWLQSKIEGRFQNGYQLNREQKLHRLQKIIDAETFESELHRKFVGSKRFSMQGAETAISMLDTMLEEAAQDGVKRVIFGMAHRGRLNVLANILGKELKAIFSEFEDQSIYTALGSGDVKYHMGAETVYTDIFGRKIDLLLAPNPSHLEFVNPVVEGIARAYQDSVHGKDRKAVLPVLIHGDAAFAGQGVVFETINMAGVSGYTTGGTIHLIINNQVGFTTDPQDSRTSVYCTDMAKAIQAPVFHVNCENVEAACWSMKCAVDFRNRYGRDVLIDLYSYRKYGHNEGDDPSFTQPVVYSEIKDKKRISQIYAEQLKAEGVITDEDHQYEQEYKARFAAAQVDGSNANEMGLACSVHGRLKDPSPATGVPVARLKEIAKTLVTYPEGFVVHPKLKTILEKRVESLEVGHGIEWGFAEGLAFGSLIQEGIGVRLSGQDCGRGTFSHRHLALSHYLGQTDKYYPLQSLEGGQSGFFEVVNSTLSEAAVLGYEFGYSTVRQDTLVLWEAQFGDFVNGAQVLIDQFISASEAKWSQRSGVVLLLPHGYEGQGPEHSSARPERFLQLCAEGNMFFCYPSSSAQYFHMLRRHGRLTIKRPLIVMTPKSLLRLPEAAATAEELINGRFETVIPEEILSKGKKKTVIFLSGKVYYDLKKEIAAKSEQLAKGGLVISRVEQLYPFPKEELKEVLDEYGSSSIYWLQEEPKNMGGWQFMDAFFREELGKTLKYIGRPAAASTATGSGKWHNKEQQKLLNEAIDAILADSKSNK